MNPVVDPLRLILPTLSAENTHVRSLPVVLIAALSWVGNSSIAAPTPDRGAQSAMMRSSESGIVAGRVRNSSTGIFLANARIHLEGTDTYVLTSRDGTYSFAIPAGAHSLVVSYSGLETKRVPVEVMADKATQLDIELSSGIYSLERFVVKGIREETADALQQERYAPNPKTVLSTSAFGKASENPGDLLQRMAGVSTDIIAGEVTVIYIRGMNPDFSTLLVDGEQVASSAASTRQYQINQWGTANLAQVEMIKAPTSDQDANAVAGFVNLVSKRGFDSDQRQVSLTLSTGLTGRGLSFSPFQNRVGDTRQASVSFSDAFGVMGGRRNLGVTFNASRINTSVFNEEAGSVYFGGLTSVYTDPSVSAPLQRLFGAGDYISPNLQENLGSRIDLKLSDNSNVFINLFYNTRHQYQSAYRVFHGFTGATAANFTPDSTPYKSTLLPNANATATNESFNSVVYNVNYGFNGGGDFKWDRQSALSFRANYSYSRNASPGFARAMATSANFGFTLDRTTGDPFLPKYTLSGPTPLTSADSFTMRTLTRQTADNPNSNYGARVDYTRYFETASPTSIKMGLKYNDNPRKNRVGYVGRTFVGPTGAPGVAADGSNSLARYSPQSIPLTRAQYGPFPFMGIPFTNKPGDPFLLPENYWGTTASDVYTNYANSNASNYDISESISAAYVQGHVNFGRLRILAGLRAEATSDADTVWLRNVSAAFGSSNVGGASVDPTVKATNLARAQKSFVTRSTTKASYENVFPALHFVYEPLDGLLARASYNKSISRPPITSMLPTVTENPDTNSVTIGNAELKPYTSDNFEVTVEKYFEPVGKFSAGVFLKNISNYFATFQTQFGPGGIDGQGTYANRLSTQTRNVGNARIRGFEIGYQQQFTNLPGIWKAFGLFSNLTYTETWGNFGTAITSNRLALMTPRNINSGISYVAHGLQVRLMHGYRSKVYAGFTAYGAPNSFQLNYYRAPRSILDLKMQYDINKRFNVYFDVVNLTNEQTRADVGDNGNGNMYWIRLNPGVAYNFGLTTRF